MQTQFIFMSLGVKDGKKTQTATIMMLVESEQTADCVGV